MLFTEEDKLYHDTNDKCHMNCNKNCVNKVRDRCHQTGRYRGPACNICNLNYKHQNFIPVIFLNEKAMTSIYYLNRCLNRIIAGEELISYLVLMVKLECLEWVYESL